MPLDESSPRASACFFLGDAMACIHPVAKLPSESRPSYAAVIDMHATGNRSLALVYACRLTCQRLQQSKLPDVSLLVPATPERPICSGRSPGGAPAIQVKCKQDRSTFFSGQTPCVSQSDVTQGWRRKTFGDGDAAVWLRSLNSESSANQPRDGAWILRLMIDSVHICCNRLPVSGFTALVLPFYLASVYRWGSRIS